MDAKEKQKEFIKAYLKPLLKERGYRTVGFNWWKDKGEFFITINLQNSQWNSKDELSFCFNIGVALTDNLEDPSKKKATHYDSAVDIREDSYLGLRAKHKYRKDGWLGYLITNTTNLDDFISELQIDFENHILPSLEQFNTLNDCLEFYNKIPFWGEQLERQISELTKS